VASYLWQRIKVRVL